MHLQLFYFTLETAKWAFNNQNQPSDKAQRAKDYGGGPSSIPGIICSPKRELGIASENCRVLYENKNRMKFQSWF